jgi:proteasome accessory factor A
MAIPKVLGIETEYGVAGGPGGDPILASSLLVNAYAQQGHHRVRWDFNHETPSNDARDDAPRSQLAPAIETHLANTVLTNGARFYVDHAHPEYSSPEVRTPLEAVLYDQAGEEVLRRALIAVNETLPDEEQVRLYKNNSDGKGNAYGTHENYLVSRDVAFDDLVRAMVPHFISRVIITGAGKVGAETDLTRGYGAPFQVSARAEFFEEVVGLETTLKRPIMNTRDEPHAAAEHYRRLHVINGDANLSPTATFLKLGVTALLLCVIETQGLKGVAPMPDRPVSAFWTFGRDPSLTATVETSAGRWTALNYQEHLYELVASFIERHDATAVADALELRQLLDTWLRVLDGLTADPTSLAGSIDWVAKQRLVEGYRARHGLDYGDARLAAIDLQYHDLDPRRSLAARSGLHQLFTPDEIANAVSAPPPSTRAFFRGTCLTRFSEAIVSANWDSLVVRDQAGQLHRIPMDEPLRGTAALTADLFDQVSTIDELLVALTG